MTLVIDLSPEEEKQIQETAKHRGLDVRQYIRECLELPELKDKSPAVQEKIRQILASKPAAPNAKAQAAIDLLYQWRVEDATDDEEELARRDTELDEFKVNMNANRALEGRPPVYP